MNPWPALAETAGHGFSVVGRFSAKLARTPAIPESASAAASRGADACTTGAPRKRPACSSRDGNRDSESRFYRRVEIDLDRWRVDRHHEGVASS